MKRLFFVMILFAGFSLGAQAQTLDYHFHNSSSVDTWKIKFKNAGPAPVVYEGLTPGQSVNGSVGGFQFPLKWKTINDNGCEASNVDNTTTPAVNIATSCGSNILYKIVQVAPFVHVWKLEFP